MSVKPNKVREVLSNNILADGFEPIIDLEKSHHSWLVDARDGSEYLDMFSMYASGSIGYNHSSILDNKDVLTKASLFKPTLSDIFVAGSRPEETSKSIICLSLSFISVDCDK